MKPEEQRIAIAKYLAEIEGFYRLANGGTAETVPLQYLEPGSDGGLFLDYCRDLNAMHLAEVKIQCGEFQNYTEALREVVYAAHPNGTEAEFDYDMLHATAPQRAEAFLKTIGKWTDQ